MTAGRFSDRTRQFCLVSCCPLVHLFQNTFAVNKQQQNASTMSLSPRGRAPVYQIDFMAVQSGKRIASTKRRIRWFVTYYLDSCWPAGTQLIVGVVVPVCAVDELPLGSIRNLKLPVLIALVFYRMHRQ
jgi:hypothetical protein